MLAAHGILVPWPGIELVSPALPGRFLTSRLLGESLESAFQVLGDADDACLGTTFRTAVHDEASAYFSDFCLYIMPPLTMPTPARMPTMALGVEDGERNRMSPFVHPLE